jgi:Fe-S cluster assembly scaffold protein SufB
MAKINAKTTVYSAAAWWRDSDPSMQAVALTAKRAQQKCEALMKHAAREARDDESYKSIVAALDDIAWSGVHTFKLGDLASSRELDDAIQDLEDNGVWYPETA